MKKSPALTMEDLYSALYEPLDSTDNPNEKRERCLSLLIGNNDLKELLSKYETEQDAIDIIEGVETKAHSNNTAEFEEVINFWRLKDFWEGLNRLYCNYIERLKNKTIDKIIIYEAPPMPKEGKINYLLHENPKGAWSDCIKKLVDKKGHKDSIEDILVNSGILFLDLCTLPLPLTSLIRKDVWGKCIFDSKPLSVILLELAFRHVIEKGVRFAEKPIIAMGAPSVTSQSIYLYYANNKSELSENCLKINLSKLMETNHKYEKEGQILPLYRSNILSGNNYPNSDLLKRIFNKHA